MTAIKGLLYLQAAFEHVPQLLIAVIAVYLSIMETGIVVHFLRGQMQRNLAVAEVLERHLKEILSMVSISKTHKIDCVHILQISRYGSLYVSCQLQCEVSGHSSCDMNYRYAVRRRGMSVSSLRRLSVSASASAYSTYTGNNLWNANVSHLLSHLLCYVL